MKVNYPFRSIESTIVTLRNISCFSRSLVPDSLRWSLSAYDNNGYSFQTSPSSILSTTCNYLELNLNHLLDRSNKVVEINVIRSQQLVVVLIVQILLPLLYLLPLLLLLRLLLTLLLLLLLLHVIIYQNYPIALFSSMAEKNFQKYGARENPQKCSQCKQPGHNKGSSRCPVNQLKAQTLAIAAQRKETFQMVLNQEKITILQKQAESPASSSKKIRSKYQIASRMTLLV